VQTEAAAPLNRAWRLVHETEDWQAADPTRFMWPWEEVGTSKASGILDDVTYDWLPVMDAMLTSGGRSHVIPERLVEEGNRLVRERTGIDADHTGTAGAAALLDPTIAEEAARYDHVVVFLTGRQRQGQSV
jgi:hypothetical protein